MDYSQLALGGATAIVAVKDDGGRQVEASGMPEAAQQLAEHMISGGSTGGEWETSAFVGVDHTDITRAVQLFCSRFDVNRVEAGERPLGPFETDEVLEVFASALPPVIKRFLRWAFEVRVDLKASSDLLRQIAVYGPVQVYDTRRSPTICRRAQDGSRKGSGKGDLHAAMSFAPHHGKLKVGLRTYLAEEVEGDISFIPQRAYDMWLAPGLRRTADKTVVAKRKFWRTVQPASLTPEKATALHKALSHGSGSSCRDSLKERDLNESGKQRLKTAIHRAGIEVTRERAKAGLDAKCFQASYGDRMDLEDALTMEAGLRLLRAARAAVVSARARKKLLEIADRQGVDYAMLLDAPACANAEADSVRAAKANLEAAEVQFHRVGRFNLPTYRCSFAAGESPDELTAVPHPLTGGEVVDWGDVAESGDAKSVADGHRCLGIIEDWDEDRRPQVIHSHHNLVGRDLVWYEDGVHVALSHENVPRRK